jgi:hypothetical protein
MDRVRSVSAPVTQRIHLLHCLPYPSNRNIHSICYGGKERLANGKREFKEEEEEEEEEEREYPQE